MSGKKKKLPDWAKLVNCAECRQELLGESMKVYVSLYKPDGWPPMMAGRIKSRPYCQECLQGALRITGGVKTSAGDTAYLSRKDKNQLKPYNPEADTHVM